MPFQSNQIAAGHNATGSYTNIEALADSTGRLFVPVDDLGKWTAGQQTLRGDGLVKEQGYASFNWVSGYITLEQWYKIYDDILNESLSGLVTAATRIYNPAVYVNVNATLTLPPPPSEQKGVNEYRPFIWRFTRVTVIP